MGYDNILSQVGEFGIYQKLLCGFFVFYTTFLCGLNYYTQVWNSYSIFLFWILNYFRCLFSTPPSTGALTQFLTIFKKKPKHLGKTCFHGSQDKEATLGEYRNFLLTSDLISLSLLVNVWWLILNHKAQCSWTKPRPISTTSSCKNQTQTGSQESGELFSALLSLLLTRAVTLGGSMTTL